jgi:hypothetical protein
MYCNPLGSGVVNIFPWRGVTASPAPIVVLACGTCREISLLSHASRQTSIKRPAALAILRIGLYLSSMLGRLLRRHQGWLRQLLSLWRIPIAGVAVTIVVVTVARGLDDGRSGDGETPSTLLIL